MFRGTLVVSWPLLPPIFPRIMVVGIPRARLGIALISNPLIVLQKPKDSMLQDATLKTCSRNHVRHPTIILKPHCETHVLIAAMRQIGGLLVRCVEFLGGIPISPYRSLERGCKP